METDEIQNTCAKEMEYTRFMALNAIILISAAIIYVGCRRSYSIYFFERDTKRVIFLEEAGAGVIPVVLSVLLIILYLGAKRIDVVGEEGVPVRKKSARSRRTSLAHPTAQKASLAELDSIPEASSEAQDRKSSEASYRSNRKSVEQAGSKSSELSVGDDVRPKSSLTERVLEQLARESEEVSEMIKAGGESPDDTIHLENLPSRRRKSSILDDHELAVERKRSQIYKEIGKISFLPSTLGEVITKIRRPSIRNMPKQSLFDVLVQFIGVHIPLWLSVIAVHITLVEIFNNKLYYLFYYYQPGMKLLAMIIALLLGLFHEAKWTWFVNDILSVAAAYVVIARVETASYFAGFVFILGMITFDVFWTYGIDVLSTVMKQGRPPLMVIIPWGKEGKREMISIVDIMVPGIFLNVIYKFADMYDARAFFPPFYAVVSGLMITLIVAVLRQKTTPAMVIPGVLAILISMLCVDNPTDLWRFEIKH